MKSNFEKLNSILKKEWEQLELAIKSAKHPFHHFVLSNVINHQPESRIVILRSIDKKNLTLGFNTDKRSPKYLSLLNNNKISALFYDKERKVQLRINGYSQANTNEIEVRSIWDNMALESRICYMGKHKPSSTMSKYEPNIPLKKITEISDTEFEKGYKNFINFQITIKTIDRLYLHSSGHQRVKFEWNSKKLTCNWIAT